MPDPITIVLDQPPPTEPGDYLLCPWDGADVCLAKVCRENDEQLGVYYGNAPLPLFLDELINARWSVRLNIEVKP